MHDEDYDNRRRHPRINATLGVRISTIEPERDPWSGKAFFRATQETCGNLSCGGAFVQTAEPLAPGRRVLLELKLPDGSPLEAIGRVAWTKRVMTPHERDREAGIGVEFIGAAPDQFSALEDFIAKRSDD
jgi:uncharacterized protein (TIGR02266 family)